MTSQMLILLLALLAVGVATSIYCFWRRGASSSREPTDIPASDGEDGDSPTEDGRPSGAPDEEALPGSIDQNEAALAALPECVAGEGVGDSRRAESLGQAHPEGIRTVAGEHRPQNHVSQEDLSRADGDTSQGDNSASRDGVGSAAVSEDSDGMSEIGADADAEVSAESQNADDPGAPRGPVGPTPEAVVLGDPSEEFDAGAVLEEEDENDIQEGQEEIPASTSQARKEREKPPKKKRPRKYEGLNRSAPEPQDNKGQTGLSDNGEPTTRVRSLPIEVRLRFDRGGFCNLSLIAKRSDGLPEEITVAAPSGEVELRAMQDEWYQDVIPEDISSVLCDGTVWTQAGINGQSSWSLSGRDLYVLAARYDISGYVSQACLDLGRDHAVLCSKEIESQVHDAIEATGAEPTALLDESLGSPPGWVVFRNVVPRTSVPLVAEADVLNALRPIPQIEISLEGGIRLEYANWLEGHPPLIRVYGSQEDIADVRVDGHHATCGGDGVYRVAGWDSVGSHSIWCAGTNKSYSIVPFSASWERWNAYAFPVAYGSAQSISICGPLVQALDAERHGKMSSISVPETNPVLLGAAPGEYALARRVPGVRGAPLIASPRFRPIWALPCDPLHCDKTAVSILLIGEEKPQVRESGSVATARASSDLNLDAWYRSILDASRKGLRIEPDTEPVRALWLSYKRVARRIWRARG